MDERTASLERAFELACAGEYKSIVAIKMQLRSEGYSVEQVTGRTLIKKLRELIEKARQ
jgi:hypothetical protein